MFSLSDSIRLKWDPLCLLTSSHHPVGNCQTGKGLFNQSWNIFLFCVTCQDVSRGPWSSGQRISWCFVLWEREETSHPWQRAWHHWRLDWVHLLSHNNRYLQWIESRTIIVIMHWVWPTVPWWWCGDQVCNYRQMSIIIIHSDSGPHKGWLYIIVKISINENKWVQLLDVIKISSCNKINN